MRIELDTLVDDVMRSHPATIRTFLNQKMACVGCPIAGFHTVADACREHGVEAASFLAALHAAVVTSVVAHVAYKGSVLRDVT